MVDSEDERAILVEHRKVLAEMVLRLFSHWRLTETEKAVMLGLDATSEFEVDDVFDGLTPRKEAAIRERIGHLLAIHRLLRSQFPQNREVAYSWMHAPNRAFGGQSPVMVVKQRGLEGLLLIRAYLARSADV